MAQNEENNWATAGQERKHWDTGNVRQFSLMLCTNHILWTKQPIILARRAKMSVQLWKNSMAKFSEIRIQKVPESDKLQLELIARNEGFKSVNELVRNLINEKIRQTNASDNVENMQIISEEWYINIMRKLSEIELHQQILTLKLDS